MATITKPIALDETLQRVAGALENIQLGKGAEKVIAEIYNNNAVYAVGDYTIHDGKLYSCSTAIATPESWTEEHWVEILLSDEVKRALANTGTIKDVRVDGVSVVNNGIANVDGISNIKNSLIENAKRISLNAQYFNADTITKRGYDVYGSVINADLQYAAIVYQVPCSAGDVITYYGQGDYAYSAVVYFDNAMNVIGHEQSPHTVKLNAFTAPESTAFIGVFSYNTPDFYFKIENKKLYGGILAFEKMLDNSASSAISKASDIAFDIMDGLFDTETISPNLFDKSKIIKRQYWQGSTILKNKSTSYATFGPMLVFAGTYKYNINYGLYGNNWTGCRIVDKDMNCIEVVPATYGENNEYMTFTINKVCYISLNCDPAFSHMLCLETEYPDSYVPYTYPVIDEAYLPEKEQNIITKEDSANLFDKDGEILNAYFMADGRTVDSGRYISQYIPFDGTGEYYFLGMIGLYGINSYKIPLFDSDKNYIGNITPDLHGQSSGTGPISMIVNSDNINGTKIAYIGYTTAEPVQTTSMFVHSNEYPSEFIPYSEEWTIPDLTYHIPAEEFAFAETNHLKGKKVVFDGDSICDASSEVNTGETIAKDHRGWAGRIIDGNAMEGWNVGVGGGTITAELYSGTAPDLVPRHWLSRYIDTIHTQHPTLDYLIIEGGTNDADLLRSEIDTKLGTLSMTDWSGNYDDTTFTGALESLFYKALNYYPNTKIGYIVAQKMGRGSDYTKENNNRRIFFERAMEVCKKWGIPYINLWDESPLNPRLDIYYDTSKDSQGNRDAGTAYIDGQHLTKEGYDIIAPKIEQWMRGL